MMYLGNTLWRYGGLFWATKLVVCSTFIKYIFLLNDDEEKESAKRAMDSKNPPTKVWMQFNGKQTRTDTE